MKTIALIFALVITKFCPFANAAAFAGAGIEVDGKRIGGYGITWNEETRGNLVGQLSKRSITFERDYNIPISKENPNVAELKGRIRITSNIRGTSQVEAEPETLKLIKHEGKWRVEADSIEQALQDAAKNNISAYAVQNRCRITAEIAQTDLDPARWAAMMAKITIRNTTDEERKISFYCHISSQDSKSPKNASVFASRTYDLVLAPRESIVREFPFIDLQTSKPGDLKDTVIIMVANKPFEGNADPIDISPANPRDLGDDPVTIAVMKLRR